MMKKIGIALCMVTILVASLMVGTAYATNSNASGNRPVEWVTGGGQIYIGPPGSQSYTFAGTVGKTVNGDINGNMVVIDRFNNAILRFIKFDSMDVVGNAATFAGTVEGHAIGSKEYFQFWVTMTITDNGEPGAGVDTLAGDSAMGPFGGVLAVGNFQVHSK